MKKKTRLIWQLYPSYIGIIFVSLLIVSVFTSSYIEEFFLKNTRKDLLTRGRLIKYSVSHYLNPLKKKQIDEFCKELGQTSQTRITIILPNGVVIGDSEKDPAVMNNHKNRPEVLSALDGKDGSSTRDSETLRMKMMYVAVPLIVDSRVVSVVRVAIPVNSINNTVDMVKLRVMMIGFLIAILASVVSLFMSRRISRPIEEMKKGAMKYAQGELGYRLHEPFIAELASLADVMNHTAANLEERIATVKRQRNEYEAVLSSMTEGVVGVDRDKKIITINKAALKMLSTDRDHAIKRSVQEVSRNSDFNKIIQTTVETGEFREEDVSFFRDGTDKTFNIKSTVLKNPESEKIGVLIVLNDVTHLRRLENMRKDFAANVSHELKTPLTSIKGFVETLRFTGGDRSEEEDRFLSIIDKHVDRLTAIIDDLMELSRIEQKGEISQIKLKPHKIETLILSVIDHCQRIAREQGVTVNYSCDGNLKAPIDGTLMEQAVNNLLENAIKYSKNNNEVAINAEMAGNEIRIHVRDHGIGIDEKHHSRLFERFYRVDKARSRKLGGTGLGLAIVKHVVLAHGGDVSVESRPGQGSRFTITIPA